MIFFHVSRNPGRVHKRVLREGNVLSEGNVPRESNAFELFEEVYTHVFVTLIAAIETPPFVTLIDFSIYRNG